jgi:hypothetical protein
MDKQSNAIGYCRVTDPTITDPDLSLQVQEDEIIEAAEVLNFSMEALFIDDWASIKEYEYLNEAFQYCQRHEEIRYLLITEPSRISRNVRVFNMWQKNFREIGVEIKCALVEDNTRNQRITSLSAEVDDICHRASLTTPDELDTITQDFLEKLTQLVNELGSKYRSPRITHELMSEQSKELEG